MSSTGSGSGSQPSSPITRLDSPSKSKAFDGKRVSFVNTAGDALVGTFTDRNSPEVVLLCHGYASTKDSPLMQLLAKELASKDLSSLRFDFSGNGEEEV